eukprot:TRINITY_DN9864_c0_g1_i3.p2 TRINITY_DN9864_c0_g1~~TRINITY_DN9864_c0_g1_i3.p2  ORF type:complete len:156 (-),score=34.63 TRINITY_DN9864_c0_g1_i3:394-801(-)
MCIRDRKSKEPQNNSDNITNNNSKNVSPAPQIEMKRSTTDTSKAPPMKTSTLGVPGAEHGNLHFEDQNDDINTRLNNIMQRKGQRTHTRSRFGTFVQADSSNPAGGEGEDQANNGGQAAASQAEAFQRQWYFFQR